MLDAGWMPVSPFKWQTPAVDQLWDAADRRSWADLLPLLKAIHACAERRVWQRAGQHRHDLGAERGVDWTVARKDLRHLRKKHLGREAATLVTVLAAGQWPAARMT